MKVSLLAVVALTAVVAFTKAADPECLYRKLRGLSKHWPNPLNCSKYYKCSAKNVARSITCPKGKEYNPKNGKCGNEGRGLCKLSLAAPLAGDTNPCADEVSGAFIAKTDYCGEYYICHQQAANPQTCPSGSYFDLANSNCIPDSNSSCWQNQCIGKADASFLPYGSSCLSFIVCEDEEATIQYCDSGSYFDTSENKCVPDEGNTHCWENFCIDKSDGTTLADPDDCTSFYTCSNSIPSKSSCPSDSYYDPTTLNCESGTCPVDSSTEPCEEEQTTTPVTEPCDEEATTESSTSTISTTAGGLDCDDGVTDGSSVPDTDNCAKYFKCENGVLVPNSCITGSYFDEALNICVVDSNNVCPESSSPDECDENSVAPDGTDCWHYYTCDDGQWKEEECGKGQYFDTTLGACSIDANGDQCPENAETRNVRSKRSVESEGTTSDCGCDGGIADGQIVAHPTDCEKYQICQNNVLVDGTCGFGNIFNNCTNVCVPDTNGVCWVCKDKPNGYLVPNSEQCNGYYQCSNGLAGPASTCPNGQLFNGEYCEVDVTGECIDPCSCTPNGAVAHPICTKYFQCRNGVAQVASCPAGEAFDPETSNCCASVSCNALYCENSISGTTYPVENDVTSFYYCMNNEAFIRTCLTNEAYNETLAICLPQPSCACNQAPCANTTESLAFASQNDDETSFCLCNDGAAYLKYCSSGFVFDEDLEICLFTGPCDPNACVDHDDMWMSPNYEDPDSFCLCLADQPVVVACPIGYTFSITLNKCVVDIVADPRCDLDYCVDKPDNTVFPALNSNTSFCLCTSQKPIYENCPEDKVFSPTLQICIYWSEEEEQNSCGGVCDSNKCADVPDLTYFPAQNNNTGFCYCKENEASFVPCPSNKTFDTTLMICMDPTEPFVGICDPGQCSGDNVFKATNGTSGFCYCQNSEVFYRECPSGKEFREYLQICLSLEDVSVYCNSTKCTGQENSTTFVSSRDEDNTSFCICLGGTAFFDVCPSGTFFDRSAELCLEPMIPMEICDTTQCASLAENESFLAQNGTTGFCYCVFGLASYAECPTGAEFNSTANACLDKQIQANLACDSSVCDGRTRVAPFAADDNNTGFCMCDRISGQVTFRACAPNKFFDPLVGVCVSEEGEEEEESRKKRSIGTEENQPCHKEEKRSVPSNCSQYDLCIDERWQRRSCPNQQYYNVEEKKCLEPLDDTVCNYSRVIGLPACTNHNENQTLSSKKGNCLQYFRCVHQKWRLRSCSKRHFYMPHLHTCLPFGAKLNDSISSDVACEMRPANKFVYTGNQLDQKCQDTAVRAAPAAAGCAMFLMCLDNSWWYQQCPLSMFFSHRHSYCVPNDAGQCPDAQFAAQAGEKCQDAQARRSSNYSCNHYYSCTEATWQLSACPVLEFYNATLQACVRDEHGACAQTAMKCMNGQKRAVSNNCTVYEMCVDGLWMRQSCPPLMRQFDTICEQCVVRDDSSCELNGMRRACQAGAVRPFPLSSNCSQFYYCDADEWQPASCLRGHTFSSELRICVPHAVDDKCQPFWQGSHYANFTDKNYTPLAELTNGSTACLQQPNGQAVPYAGDCTRFYLCINEWPSYAQTCALGSFFDASLGYCRPNDGTCTDRVGSDAAEVCSKLNETALVAYNQDCRAYYNCSKGNDTQLSYCPSGEYFDNGTAVCRVDSGECAAQMQKRKNCAGLAQGTRIAHELYCNLYYVCVRGLAVPVECADNHHFNPILGACVYDELRQCQDGQFAGDGEGFTYSCGNLQDGSYLADRNDCTRYYICSDGMALQQRCSAGAYFNADQLLCVRDDGSCPFVNNEENNEPSTNTTAVPPDASICESKHGYIMADASNCNNFYICISGKLRHERCYSNYFFNASLNQCQELSVDNATTESVTAAMENATSTSIILGKEPHSASGGGKRSLKLQCYDKPTDFADLCEEIGEGSFIAEQGDCRRYISCEADEPVSQRCRNGESYDSLLEICRQNDGTCLLENGERVGVCNGKHGQLTRDADDCRGYFVCLHGQKIESECSENEFFNKTTNICEMDILQQCQNDIESTKIITKNSPP